MTICLMILPLFYLECNLNISLANILPNIFQKPSTPRDFPSIKSSTGTQSDKVKTQVEVEDWPITVIGNSIYYEWELLNGTGRIAWSGTTFDPANIQISNTEEGFDLYMSFSFDTLEWGKSLTYLGYAVPI